MSEGTPLDLCAMEARLKKWPPGRRSSGELASEVAILLAALRATRAALEVFLQSCPYHNEDAQVEYWADVRERAAAVLAQVRDDEPPPYDALAF